MIYLDYNSTAPLSKSVVGYVRNGMVEDYANPASSHNLGFKLKARLDTARRTISDFLETSVSRIVFTAGATEAVNTVLNFDNIQRQKISTVISSRMEHKVTLECLRQLETRGIKVEYVKTANGGALDYNHLECLMSANPGALVSLLFVNNETGVINDVHRIAQIAKGQAGLVHIDAVQALGKLPISLDDLNVDFASFSGHKIGALKGCGILYVRDRTRLIPILHGGGQEFGLRSGTHNFPAIWSFKLALEDLDLSTVAQFELQRNNFEQCLKFSLPGSQINAADHPRVYNISNLFLPSITAQESLLSLGRKGIYVAVGSACTSGQLKGSHVITEIYGNDRAEKSIRLSVKGEEWADFPMKDFVDVIEAIQS